MGLILDVVPFYQSHHRIPNTVFIYHVLTTYYLTPNIVSISTLHSHLCHAMSRAYVMQNAIACISCHMHNECYMDNTIHTTYRCHGESHHLHMTSINHFIHVNLSCKHISTFTFNISFYDQAMTHTSKPCNGHCT